MKPLDTIDKKILALLQKNARMTVKEMSKQLNLSSTPIFERIKKLEKNGVIDHYTVVLNQEKMGKKLNAFVHISLKDHSKQIVEAFVERIMSIPEVVECHFTTGNYSIFIKVLCKNNEHLMHLLNDSILSISGVISTETFISLDQQIDRQIKI